MSDWRLEQITHGTDHASFHSHSYYDINVFDSDSHRIVAHRMDFAERRPTAQDTIDIGIIDIDDHSWHPIGMSRAWSWQQGPMAQWIPGQSQLLWNDREKGRFVTRIHDLESGQTRTLSRPSYAVDPRGGFTLSVNMARLDKLRPGYGYGDGDGAGARLEERHPTDDGVWRQPLDGTGDPSLILSLDRAVRFMHKTLGLKTKLSHLVRGYRFWFNHVKLSPNGKRFTVKLRFRSIGKKSVWSGRQGVSLTCGTDGNDLRLLADATSHVIWLDNDELYLWRIDGFYVYADEAPRGRSVRQIAPELLDYDVHLRYLPGSSRRFVFDTPYREEIDLFICDHEHGVAEKLAHFENHRPKRSEFRCDLHPCPSPDARKIVVTSLHDGGRQIYLLRKDSPE